MKKHLAAWILISASAVSFAVAAPAWSKAETRISAIELYDWVKVLTGKEFGGRLSGHPGYDKAARWAAAKFESWGLRPIDEKQGYLQSFPSPLSVVESAALEAEVWKSEGDKESVTAVLTAEAMKDFLPLVFSDSGETTSDLVFVGWGISAPELGYDDFAGVDVRGKFAMCFRGTPTRDPRFQYHDEHRTRMKVAKDKGAVGLVYIYPEVSIHPNGDFTPGFTPMMISEDFADQLFKEQGITSARIRRDLQTYRRPISFPVQARLKYRVKTHFDPAAESYNIVGWIEGRDPRLRREVVILGGHFDGVGEHMGFFCPAANDNASGSAVLMGVAKALADPSIRPKRSILVVLFGGEEKGMQGSDYFADNLPPQFEKMAAMFNYDMVGAGDRAFASVSVEPAGLKEALLKADESSALMAATRPMTPPGVRGGDVTAFFNKGVPCVYFMTNGPFPDYHRPGDSIYRVNPEIMADLARLTLRAAYLFADR
ncbi:MAG: M20/M25/M40 family metallo-hydrolase [Acidobacteriota bacterium]|nr:M20/M25/M40 family metallo-hydrolase [Acidobacteriota bacterium]